MNMKRLASIVLTILMGIYMIGCSSTFAGESNKPKILFVAFDIKGRFADIDATYKKELTDLGYIVETATYEGLTAEKAGSTNIIVLGELPEMSAGDKSVFTSSVNEILYKFVEEGGGLLFLPSPGKYGHKWQQEGINKFLEPWDAQVIFQDVEDTKHKKYGGQYLGYKYWYASTSNIGKHPISEGVKLLWYPISPWPMDTHTMKVGKGWNVVVKGELSASSKDSRGVFNGKDIYSSEPPLVAAREFGKGRIVLFTSLGRYWIWDAYHPWYNKGFVLREGDGFKFLTNIYSWLAEPSVKAGRLFALKEKGKAETDKDWEDIRKWPDKKEWINHVLGAVPEDMGIKYYVDCGSRFDEEYSQERGFGYVRGKQKKWRYGWRHSLELHSTAGSHRYDEEEVIYRFSNLNPKKKYSLGLLFWEAVVDKTGHGWKDKQKASVFIDSEKVMDNISLPSYEEKEEPEFKLINIPGKVYRDGTIDIKIKKVVGKTISISEIWIFGEDCPRKWEERSTKKVIPVYKGMIGVHTTYSDGHNTVKEFSDKAKDLGYSYLVFSDRYEDLTKEKWEQLLKDCLKESNDNFVAIPGFEVTLKGKQGKNLFKALCFNFEEFRDNLSVNNAHTFLSTMLLHIKATVVISTPDLNLVPPKNIKFWNSIAVASYDRGKLIDIAEETYRDLVASNYHFFPIADNRVYRLKELEQFEGYTTYVWAESVKDIPNSFVWLRVQGMPDKQTFVSNGPIINEFMVEGGLMEDYWLCYYLWGQGDLVRLNIDVSSDHPLKEVIIYQGKNVLRRFKPNSNRFVTTLHHVLSKEGLFSMVAIDTKGRRAISNPILTRNRYFHFEMCGDQQGEFFGCLRDSDKVWGAMMAHWTFWRGETSINVLLNVDKIRPRGYEVPPTVLKGFETGPVFHTIKGKEFDQSAIPSLLFSSQDCIIHQHYYESESAKTTSKYIGFRPKLVGGYNIILVELKTEIKKDIPLADRKEGIEVNLFSLVNIGRHSNYTLIGPKITQKGSLVQKRTVFSSAKMNKNGYIALWPYLLGSWAVYPLDQTEYSLDLTSDGLEGRKSLTIGYENPGEVIPAGAVWHNRFLFVLENGEAKDDTVFEHIRDVYGLDGEPAYQAKLSQGKVLDNVYALSLEAENYYVAGRISQAQLPNDLGVVVKGINSNWDAGVYDNDTKILRRVGVFEDKAYLTLDISKTRNIFIGNLLVCNNEEIKLTLLGIEEESVKFIAHNPTERKVSVVVKGARGIAPLSEVSQSLILNPGEVKVVNFEGERTICK